MQKKLDQLIDHWQNKKIITAKQATQMREDIALDATQRNKNRFIMALSSLGAIALGIGVILFVSSNWEVLPKGIKLLLALVLPVLPMILSYWLLLVKKTYISLGRGALIVGMLMIGAAMAIIGQVYHLESEYVRFLGVWTLLAAPFAYFFKRKEAVLLVAVLFGGFIAAFMINLAEGNRAWEEFVAVGFPLAYVVYGGILFCIGRFFSENTKLWQASGPMLRVLGVKLALLSLFVMTFEFYADILNDVGFGVPEDITRLFLNLFYVVFLVYVLQKAIKAEAQTIVSAVFFWFGVFILFRYFDFFWDMLPTSLFFIVGGALFIGGAVVLEKQRKKLLSSFDDDSVVKNMTYDE